MGHGLVARLDRPGGNVTGVASLSIAMTPKRLQLLYGVVPTARVMALLVNPANPIVAESQAREARSAAQTLGVNVGSRQKLTLGSLPAVFTKSSTTLATPFSTSHSSRS